MIVVVDFDGTLAIGDTSDLENMTPNIPIVRLINELHGDNNIINVVTARGSKTCDTLKEREIKYLDKIKKWLRIHNVKYDSISFNKEYGDVYLDDKCFNVKDSIFYEKLDSNFTDNKVRRLNNIVTKKTDTSINEFTWFIMAEKLGLNIPEILSYDKNTIATNYISGKKCDNFNLIYDVIKIFKDTKPSNNSNYESYIGRIDNHLKNNNQIIGGNILIENLKSFNIPNTFNHGDFSIYNLIEKNDTLYLIDPILSDDLFQSYYIDVSKHLFSILFYTFDYELYEYFRKNYIHKFNLDSNIIDVLIASESVRVSNKKNKFYDITNNLIDSLHRI
jgi:tRNA A-37 threonylcarbamoyl transferase component Bud32